MFLLAIAANPSRAARVERKELVLQGLALDRAGKPLSGARIFVTGDMETNTIAGPDGRFSVTLPVGTVAEVRQRPLRFILDARAHGKNLRVEGGAAKLEIVVRGAGSPDALEAAANLAQLGEAATRTLQTPKSSAVPFELTFTSGRDRPASARNLAALPPAGSPATPPAPTRPATPAQDPRVREADSLLDFREPAAGARATNTRTAGARAPDARATGAAPRTEPITPVMNAVPGTRAVAAPPVVAAPVTPVVTAPPPVAAATGRPVVTATGTPMNSPATTPARTSATPPMPSRSEALADSSRAANSARDARRPGREPPTALEMLEAARRRGTILAGEAERDSLRALDRQRRARPRDAEVIRTAANDESQRQAAKKNLRENERARAREREELRSEESHRLAVRRDSALAAMRERDSLATIARAIEKFQERERQDSLRALRAGPRLDRRIPVPGRAARVEEPGGDRQSERQDQGCFCNVEGTIEVRSDRPIRAPFGVTVTVRGRPAMRDRVLLFMGAPREFVIGRVPCGTRYLDVLPEPGRPYTVERMEMLGPFDCESGTLRQIRLVLVPR